MTPSSPPAPTSTARRSSAPPRRMGKTPQEFTTLISNEFRTSGTASASSTTTSSAPRTRSTTKPCAGSSSAAARTATSIRAATPASTAFPTKLYVNDAKPGDPCPDCGRPTETVTEENYFFKLSAFADRLLKLLRRQSRFHPARIAPQRSDQLRARRSAGSLHQPHHHQMGHPARRRATSSTSGSTR